MNAKISTQITDTWIDILFQQAKRRGDTSAFLFLKDGKITDEPEFIDFQTLLMRAQAIAVDMQDRCLSGQPVPLVYRSGLSFIEAFFGTLFAGAIAVPVKVPGLLDSNFADRLNSLVQRLGARQIYTNSDIGEKLQPMLQVGWSSCSSIDDANQLRWRHPGITTATLALIQYTSGSTSDPKGVCISHQNLIANCRAFTKAGFYQEGGHHVSWMPHYHDMGLVGSILGAVYGGVTSVLMAPQSFIRSPLRWLNAISHYRASSSGGPSFAYALAAEKCSAGDLLGLDLAHWASAYCGAEPVQSEILARFADKFSGCGFCQDAFLPCYGMAEATLFVTACRGLSTLPPLHSAEGSQPVVSVGQPADSTEICIVDPVSLQPMPDQHSGEIWVRGPGVARGYHLADDAPNDLNQPFNRSLKGHNDFYRTGDLGFLSNGDLYINGRCKDLIVIRGQNFYPQDIEQLVESKLRVSGSNSVLVFASHDNQVSAEESFTVLVGVRSKKWDNGDSQKLLIELRSEIVAHFDVVPEDIVLIPARHIPKTSSGKMQRSLAKTRWNGGELEVIARLEQQNCQQREQQREQITSEAKTDRPLYPKLTQALAKLEHRNTRYQFDLDKDIDWSRSAEPGRYYTDKVSLHEMIDAKTLKSADAEAFAYCEWAAALMKTESFADLEARICEWSDLLRDLQSGSRSLDLLDQEEVKHTELFQRYSAVMQALRPDDALEILNIYRRTHHAFLNRYYDRSRYSSDRQYHYSIWLGALYFEDYSIWLSDMLANDSSELQPTWFQCHLCHKREESQHVITDGAYIQGMDLSEEECEEWSAQAFHQILAGYRDEFYALIEHVEQRFPQVKGRVATRIESHLSLTSEMLAHKAFKQTRTAAPFARYLVEKNGLQFYPQAVSISPERLETVIREGLLEITGYSAQALTSTTEFFEIGLDSIGHLRLIAILESALGTSLEADVTYRHSTIVTLVDHLCLLEPAAVDNLHAVSAAPQILGTQSLGAYNLLNATATGTPLFWINGSSMVQAFRERLSDQQKVIFLHHHAIDGNQRTELNNLEQAVEFYVATIKNLSPNGPYRLGGHSSGALLAFEVAQRLCEEGQHVEGLCLLSPPELVVKKAEKPWIFTEFGNIWGMSMTGRLRYLKRRMKTARYFLLDKWPSQLRLKFHLKFGHSIPFDLVSMHVLRVYGKMFSGYLPETYHGSVLFIHETGYDASKWKAALSESAVFHPAIDCGHTEFDLPQHSAWVEQLNRFYQFE